MQAGDVGRLRATRVHRRAEHGDGEIAKPERATRRAVASRCIGDVAEGWRRLPARVRDDALRHGLGAAAREARCEKRDRHGRPESDNGHGLRITDRRPIARGRRLTRNRHDLARGAAGAHAGVPPPPSAMLLQPATRSAAPDSMRIADALDGYYRSQGLPAGGGDSDSWFQVHIGSFSIPLPNVPARRRAIFLHDVNRRVTGYDTTFSRGEMEIGAFEVGASCGRYLVAWYLNLSVLASGLLANPRGVFAGFVRGRRSASLYRQQLGTATLRDMTVAQVRTLLRLDTDHAPVHWRERLAFAGWSTVAIGVLLSPILPVVAVLW